MSRDDALRIEQLCDYYLQAMETHNFDALEKLWELAGYDPQLLHAFQEVNEGLAEEIEASENKNAQTALTDLIKHHLPSATPADPPAPITVADVLREMHKQPQLLQQAHLQALIAQLATSQEAIPDIRGLTALQQWAEARFGSAPPAFWKAFHHARLDLTMRTESSPQYALAARTAPKDKG